MAAPRNMRTGTAERRDSTRSRSFRELVPTPGHVFSTSRRSTITALFVTECRVSSGRYALQVRITVDGAVAHPGPVSLTRSTRYETRSYLAFKTSVPAGRHTVTVEWRVTGGAGSVRNRSFTVWES